MPLPPILLPIGLLLCAHQAPADTADEIKAEWMQAVARTVYGSAATVAN